ncbi:ABC transporter ATP-binding protein [Svornostia abyssi]|uniref:ABC transporter ATP-binding protein n=1 Tax=Svornostia abyssi TaxID=2898438 RepID=A0ABY5PIQ3_9ACTN|nr:ABC transporter ATP-binding protein [Parviterribacteraceae bacterium J379]
MTDPAVPLLAVDDLRVRFRTEEGIVRAVDGVSLDLRAGEVLAIVGESGSGKSVTALTLMGLTRGPNTDIEGAARLHGEDLVSAPDDRLRRIRGAELAIVFQDPLSALNPVQRVGKQITEQILVHEDLDRDQARDRVLELLKRVGIPQAETRIDAFPHELSGGMRQRVMIAMALSCKPKVLIADEPTTALDVTIQAQILDLIRGLKDQTGLGVILVTHDLGVVAELADRVAVMYAGRIVEQGTVDELFDDPRHPYTWGLLGSITRVDRPRPARLPSIGGSPPSLTALGTACTFAPRCPHRFEACATEPPLADADPEHPGHPDRCALALDAKRALRVVAADGSIGLAAPEEATT